MNKPPPAKLPNVAGMEDGRRLRWQAAQKKAFFAEKLADAAEVADRTGCPALVHKMHAMFIGHVYQDWVPKTFQLLEQEMVKLDAEDARLGVPALHDRDKMEETR